MKLHNLYPAKGSKHRKKILGRGEGSGHGGQSTRGGKGQTARSGERKNPGFAGGQMPLIRRIPKRGFSNRKFAKGYSIINVGDIERIFPDGAEITPDVLFERNIIKDKDFPVKVLGDGKVTKRFNISAHFFSKKAIDKIIAAGGNINKI